MTDDLGNFLFRVVLALIGLGIMFQLDAIRRHGLRVLVQRNDDDGGDKQKLPSGVAPEPGHARVVERDVPELRRRASDHTAMNFGPGAPPAAYKAIAREAAADRRAAAGMLPATFHYSDPPPWMLEHPLFEAIWDEVKTWDVNVPTEYAGYCGANGNHAAAILLAIMDRFNFDGFDWNLARMRTIKERSRQ